MRRISLGYVGIEDFKSFKGKHEIILSTRPGLKYVSGENQVNPRLGSNGAGKTTMWDAVVWCWTGYSIRGSRAADLTAWGAKSPHVLTGLVIDDDICTIERFGSPNRLLINNEPAEQWEVDRVLLSRHRLLHSVIFGQSIPFFYDLSVPDRGLRLDEVMDLGLWLKLAEKANAKSVEAGKQLNKINNDISYNQGMLDQSIEQEERLAALDTAWQITWEADIEADLLDLETREQALATDRQQLVLLTDKIRKLPDMQAMHNKVQEAIDHAYKIRTDIALAQEGDSQTMQQLIFFQNHSTCPQCQQRISDDFRQRKIASIESTVKEVETYRLNLAEVEEKAVQTSAEVQRKYQQATEHAIRLGHEEIALKQRIQQQAEDVKARAADIQARIANPNNPYTKSLEQHRNTTAELYGKITMLTAEHNEVKGEQIKYDYWRTGFRRVRLFQVKQVLARLQLETANAASALGIGDWLIEFSTEVETKSGTLKAGVHVTVKEPYGYKVAEESGGEEQRVRLAVANGFSALVQDMAGVKFDFKVYDEPSAWLSAEGIQDLLDILKDQADNLGNSVWLLDQHVLDYPFDETWHVTKTEAGSSITQQHVT